MRSRSSVSEPEPPARAARATRAGAACGLLTIALMGCGGASDQRFRSQVDSICKRSAAQLSAIPAPPSSDLPATGRFIGLVIPVVRATNTKLKAVEAPGDKSSEYKKWVAQIEQILGVISQQGLAAGSGDRTGFAALVRQQNTLLQESKAKAALLGFKQCSS